MFALPFHWRFLFISKVSSITLLSLDSVWFLWRFRRSGDVPGRASAGSRMYKVMRALRQADFDGVVIGDHFPDMVGGSRASVAYTFAYMKALRQRAYEEV